MAVAVQQTDQEPETRGLVREISLRQRLEDGYVRIDKARLHGEDVERWESFWVGLLDEYESVCRERGIAA